MKNFCLVALALVISASVLLAPPNVDNAASPKLSGLYRAFPGVRQFGASLGETYLFAANGDVYRGWIGTQSIEKFSFARAKAQEPSNTGKYTISGDKITFRWSNKTTESAAFSVRRDANGRTSLAIGPNFCTKIVAWGKVLNGTFVPSTYQGGYDPAPPTPRIVDEISFTRAGQFSIKDDNNRVTRGRYKVSGATLTLVINGAPQVHSLHVSADTQSSPPTIFLDGRPFFTKK